MPGLHGPRIPKLLDSNHGPLMPMDGFGRPGFPQGPPAPMPLGIGGMSHISHMPLPHISGDLMHPPLLGQPVPPGWYGIILYTVHLIMYIHSTMFITNTVRTTTYQKLACLFLDSRTLLLSDRFELQ